LESLREKKSIQQETRFRPFRNLRTLLQCSLQVNKMCTTNHPSPRHSLYSLE
jgi:hypothetical protein